LNFLDGFSKYIQISNFTKIHAVGGELSHADGRADRQTDMTKLIIALCNYARARKIARTKFSFIPWI